jgi:hypothetical protein
MVLRPAVRKHIVVGAHGRVKLVPSPSGVKNKKKKGLMFPYSLMGTPSKTSQ